MSRRRRKRAIVVMDPISLAIARARKLPAAEVAGQQAELRTALDEFSRGTLCAVHWLALADASNLAEGLADVGIGSDADSRQVIQRSQASLAAVRTRASQSNSYTLYAEELQALRDLVWLHGVQLEQCSAGEYHRAYDQTVKRVQQTLAGNGSPSTTVLDGQIGVLDAPSTRAPA